MKKGIKKLIENDTLVTALVALVVMLSALITIKTSYNIKNNLKLLEETHTQVKSFIVETFPEDYQMFLNNHIPAQ